jgi:hypothetical protein
MQEDHLDNQLSIVPFRYKYLPALLEMLNSQKYLGISTVNMKTLPKIGYMVLLRNYPVAAGFLRRVEGGYAQMDGLTSNPMFGSLIRHEAINLVVNSLISDAKDLKLQGILAFTGDKSVIKRSEDIGFRVIEQTLIVLSLKE